MRNVAVFLSLTVAFGGSFALSTKSADAKATDAKTSRNDSRIARNFLVPPPPPYTPSIVSSEFGGDMQAFAGDRVGGRYTLAHAHGETTGVTQPKSYVSFDPTTEKKIQKHIDSFDSEISSVEKEIGKLLNL